MPREDTRLEAPDEVQEATRALENARAEAATALEAGAGGAETARAITEATDEWVRILWNTASSSLDDPGVLVALGGYGRMELAFASDVDLVIEVDQAAFESADLRLAVERFMAWCREPRIKVAHAVRTRKQLVPEFVSDMRTAVAYLDARAITGPRADELQSLAAAHLAGDDSGFDFIRQLIEGYQVRHERFGKTVYRLEPELKNGPGGLRDLHAIRWGARVRFGLDIEEQTLEGEGWTAELKEEYLAVREWLLSIRHRLHLAHQRKHDRLNFLDQEALAQQILEDIEDSNRAAETLMMRHYQHARFASRVAERMLRSWGQRSLPFAEVGTSFRTGDGQVGLASPDVVMGHDEVFDSLKLASDRDLLLEPNLETALEEAVSSWGEGERADAKLCATLRRMITDVEISANTSSRLLDLGVLTALVPEFEPLICHVQHDVYHVYTTDVHSVRCLEAGRGLLRRVGDSPGDRWPSFGMVAAEITRPEVFLLACLFHDIGKNRGGGHSEKGALMMADVGPRLGLNTQDVELLAFLIREHLTLSRVARRRDIGDSRLIRDLASMIRTREALNQLTALTACDMYTVGDDVLTDWNASLLLQLHSSIADVLEHGIEERWQRVQTEVDVKRRELVDAIDPEKGSASRVDGFIRDLPASHILGATLDELARQFDAYEASRKSEDPLILVTPNEERGTTEVIVAAEDAPGTLARITGAISASGLNILAAQILTTGSGRTLDVFQVARSGGAPNAMSQVSQAPLRDERRIESLISRIREALTDETSVEEMLRKRMAEKRLGERPTPQVGTAVKIVDDIPGPFSVLEVKAPDRIGLLYDIASTLQKNGVNVHLSKVDSLGTQVIDTFYVEELSGGSLTEQREAELVEALQRAVESSPLLSE